MKKTIITALVLLLGFQAGRIIAQAVKNANGLSTFDILFLALLVIAIAVFYRPKRSLT